MSTSTTPTFWQQLEQLVVSDFVTDAGPDVINVLTLVADNGVDYLFTVTGQAAFMKALVALEADAIKAGSDISKQLAQLLITYLQAKFGKVSLSGVKKAA